jgi:hypothetical protein
MLSRPQSFRPRHVKAPIAAERERKQAHDKKRGSSKSRGHDATWRRVRGLFLATHPTCLECGANENQNVDHIVSVMDAPELRLVASNLRTLCHCRPQQTHRHRSILRAGAGQTIGGTKGKTAWKDKFLHGRNLQSIDQLYVRSITTMFSNESFGTMSFAKRTLPIIRKFAKNIA